MIIQKLQPVDENQPIGWRADMTAVGYADYFAEAAQARDQSLLHGRVGSALAFLIPALQFVQFHIVGTLYATDLLSLGVFLLALVSGARVLNRRLPRMFLGFGLAWLLAQVMTDLLRATPFQDYARGWAMIAFTLVNFAALYLLLSENRRRLVLCALGFVAGGFLTYFLNPNVFAATYPWKFGYGYPITLFIVLLAVFLNTRHRTMLAVVLIMGAAALNLYYDYRSLAGECFLAATYMLFASAARGRSERTRQTSPLRAILACAVLTLSTVGLLRIYAYCASDGLLGYAAWRKYEIQASGRYGVLVGGRAGFLAGLEAAMDSPIVGHGSWAKDWRYASREDAMLAGLGYKTPNGADSWLIPAHSYLVGAWVDAGIMGALFWLWVLSLPVRVLARLYAANEPTAPLIAFLAIGFIWDVLFSPFGAAQRFTASFVVVTLMWFLEAHPESGDELALR